MQLTIPQEMTAFSLPYWANRVALWAAAAVIGILALKVSINSVLLAISLTRPFVWWDEWVFFSHYLAYLDGKFSFADLFALQSEHRILTTRLVLFLDAFYFDLKGQMPIFVMYGTLLLIAALMAKITFQEERWPTRAAGFLALLALTWSICQFENLSFAFQVHAPFVHFFALLSFLALSLAISKDQKHRSLWLIAACISDFLGVFTVGSGVFYVVPAIALAVWLRRIDRFLLIFVAFHGVVFAVYLYGYVAPPYGHAPGGKLIAYVEFVANFLASSFRGW